MKFERIAAYPNVNLPKRATKGVAGYDFECAIDTICPAHKITLIPTGIKAQIDTGYYLQLAVRSSTAKKKGLIGDEKLVAIENAGLELRDYQTINFKGQDLILDLMSCGAHFIVTARETDEKVSVKGDDGKITSVATGRKIPDGFKQMNYNVKTVVRMYINEDNNFCAYISKDRTGVHDKETVEDLSLVDWQVIIDRTKDKKEFSVKNDLTKAVDIEQDIYTKEVMGKVGEPVDSIDENSAENQTTELLDKISAVMKSLNPVGKTKAKEALSAEDLPIKPTEMKKITDIKTLERVLEVISKI